MPGAEARKLAAELGKEPALVELILDESTRGPPRRARRADRRDHARLHLRQRRHRQLQPARRPTPSACCPRTPTPPPAGSAPRSRSGGSAPLGVVVADSFGRAWRLGQAEVAIGCAGIEPLDDWRGRADAAGRELEATAIAVADQAAARRRPRPRQGQRHPGGDRARPRPLRHRRGRPGGRGPAPAPRRGPLPLDVAAAGRAC